MKSEIVNAAKKRVLFLPHAIQQMSRPERMISSAEVIETIIEGVVIKEYPDDARSRSCLILHFPNDRCVHVVCTPKSEYLAIITAYVPNAELWDINFSIRKS